MQASIGVYDCGGSSTWVGVHAHHKGVFVMQSGLTGRVQVDLDWAEAEIVRAGIEREQQAEAVRTREVAGPSPGGPGAWTDGQDAKDRGAAPAAGTEGGVV